MDKELLSGGKTLLLEGIKDLWKNENTYGRGEEQGQSEAEKSDRLMEDGAIILCRTGNAVIVVNYKVWNLPEGGVIIIFPDDLVSVTESSSDFSADMLVYSAAIMREASLDIERTVYETLREDRCRSDSPVVTDIVRSMFSLLGIYFRQSECQCLERLVLCQLKAFFIGFHDYITRFPETAVQIPSSKRKRSIFNAFMRMLEQDFRKCRDISWYSDRLNITPKYLNIITRAVAGQSVKTIIDHYVILKLKQELTATDRPLKQIVWDYNFSDASFFTRYFRRHTGFTPKSWRTRHITSL